MTAFPLPLGNGASSRRRCLVQFEMPARGTRKITLRIPRAAASGHQVGDPLEMLRQSYLLVARQNAQAGEQLLLPTPERAGQRCLI